MMILCSSHPPQHHQCLFYVCHLLSPFLNVAWWSYLPLFFSCFQIRVVNAFRMGLEADSFDKRSLSSIQSQHSIPNLRMQVLKKSTSHDVEIPMSRASFITHDDTKVWWSTKDIAMWSVRRPWPSLRSLSLIFAKVKVCDVSTQRGDTHTCTHTCIKKLKQTEVLARIYSNPQTNKQAKQLWQRLFND